MKQKLFFILWIVTFLSFAETGCGFEKRLQRREDKSYERLVKYLHKNRPAIDSIVALSRALYIKYDFGKVTFAPYINVQLKTDVSLDSIAAEKYSASIITDPISIQISGIYKRIGCKYLFNFGDRLWIQVYGQWKRSSHGRYQNLVFVFPDNSDTSYRRKIADNVYAQ